VPFGPNDQFALVVTTTSDEGGVAERKLALRRHVLTLEQLLDLFMRYQAQPREFGDTHWRSLPLTDPEGQRIFHELHAFCGEYGQLNSEQMRAIDRMIVAGYTVS
jgi:hypothetical protein